MIKYEFGGSGKCVLCVSGGLSDLSAETIMLMRLVNNAIAEKDEDAAEVYRNGIEKAVADKLPWTNAEELDKKVKEAEEESDNSKEELRKSLIDLIDEVFK